MADQEQDEIIYNLSNRIARSTIAVIDTVVQRGGFKGEELSTIGQLRDQCTQVVGICENKSAADADESIEPTTEEAIKKINKN